MEIGLGEGVLIKKSGKWGGARNLFQTAGEKECKIIGKYKFLKTGDHKIYQCKRLN